MLVPNQNVTCIPIIYPHGNSTNHITAASSPRFLVSPLVRLSATSANPFERVQLALLGRFRIQKILHRPSDLPARAATLRALPLKMIPVFVVIVLPLAHLAPDVFQGPRSAYRARARRHAASTESTGAFGPASRLHHHHSRRNSHRWHLKWRHRLRRRHRVPIQRRQIIIVASLVRIRRADSGWNVIVVGYVRRHPLGHGVHRHRTVTERGPPGRWMAAIHRWPGTGLFEIETRIHPRIQHSDVAHIARHDHLTEFFGDSCVSRLKVASMNDAGVDVHLELCEIRYSWVILIAVRLPFGPVLFRYLDIYILSSDNSLCDNPTTIKQLLNTSSGCRFKKKNR